MINQDDDYYVRRRQALIDGDAGVLPEGQTAAEARAALELEAQRDVRIRRARSYQKGLDGRNHEPNQWIGSRLFPNLRKRSGCCGQ